jgi:hypothetical protein
MHRELNHFQQLELTGGGGERKQKRKAKFLPANLQFAYSSLQPITVMLQNFLLASQLLEYLTLIFVFNKDVDMDRDRDVDMHPHY